jgi:hypothetical protein
MPTWSWPRLLDETLVVMCGEMGRTPKVSPITPGGNNASGEVFTPGRHHWDDVFLYIFAADGVRGRQSSVERTASAVCPSPKHSHRPSWRPRSFPSWGLTPTPSSATLRVALI